MATAMSVSRPKSLHDLLLTYQLGLLLLLLVSGLIGGVGLYYWQQAFRQLLRVDSMTQYAHETRGHLYRQMKEVFDAAFLQDDDAMRQYEEYGKLVENDLAALKSAAKTDREQQGVKHLRDAYYAVRTQADALIRNPVPTDIESARQRLDLDLERGPFREYEQAFSSIDALLALDRSEAQARFSVLAKYAPLVLSIPFALAIALLLLSRGLLRKGLLGPLAELLRASARISSGEWTYRAPRTGAKELAIIADAFNRMADELIASRESLARAERNATLATLVPVVAHNIRNPLASIRATAQVVDDASLPRELREGLRDIIATADRLNGWTQSLLSYLHPLNPVVGSCTLQQLTDDVLRMLALELAQKNLQVIRCGRDIECELNLDVQLVEQALHGLINNAIDASPLGGSLEFSVCAENGHAKLTIENGGDPLGFCPAANELNPGPTTKRFGTGLGIPFATKAVEVHQGRIEFETPPAGGARITIVLPTGEVP